MRNGSPKDRIDDFKKLHEIKEMFKEHAEYLARVYDIPRMRITQSKARMNHAMNAITRNKDEESPKRLKAGELNRFVKTIEHAVNSGKQHILFLQIEDGSGMMDAATGVTFLFE